MELHAYLYFGKLSVFLALPKLSFSIVLSMFLVFVYNHDCFPSSVIVAHPYLSFGSASNRCLADGQAHPTVL